MAKVMVGLVSYSGSCITLYFTFSSNHRIFAIEYSSQILLTCD